MHLGTDSSPQDCYNVFDPMKLTTLTFSMTPDHFRKLAVKANLRLYVPISILLGLIGALVVAFSGVQNGVPIAGIVFVAEVAYGTLLSLSASQKRVILKLNKGIFERRRIMEFDEDGYTSRSDSGSHSYTVWSDVVQASHVYEVTNLYLSRLYVVQIPDSAFPSSRERDQLHQLLRSKSLLK